MFLRASLRTLPAAPMNGLPVRISSRAGPMPTMATRASRGPLAMIVSVITPMWLEMHYGVDVLFTSRDLCDEGWMKHDGAVINEDAELLELLVGDSEDGEVVEF